ncbi:MAG: hypothetical protein ACT4NY_25450 [Pseudonocardiales bacterium]
MAVSARAGSGRRIGMTDVEILTEQVTHLRQLDYHYGSGRIRAQVVQLMHHEVNELLHGSYTAKIGQALLITVSQATKLAGFTAADIGRRSLAQRYFIQALDLAMRASDRLYAAQVLSEMGWMTAQLGQNAPTDHDRLRYGRQAAALARAGLTVAQDAATPALLADLHALPPHPWPTSTTGSPTSSPAPPATSNTTPADGDPEECLSKGSAVNPARSGGFRRNPRTRRGTGRRRCARGPPRSGSGPRCAAPRLSRRAGVGHRPR